MSEKEKRVRKKSRRLSELEAMADEPARKKQKRVSNEVVATSDMRTTRRRRRRLRGDEGEVQGGTEKETSKRKLTVSLDFVKLKLRVKDVSPSIGTYADDNSNGSSEASFSRRCVHTRFKNPEFTFSYLASNKKRTWKNLKQILTAERSLGWGPEDPTYNSIDALPPLKPVKKYADMSGFTAKYTDPMTGIYYNTSEEFQLIRTLPSDIIQGYLALRGKLAIT